MQKNIHQWVLGLCLVSGLAWAGGGHHAETPYGKSGTAGKIDRTIVLEAKDYAFDRPDIRVKRGETIKFVVKNSGQEDHELTLGDSAMQNEHRKMMAEMPGMDHSQMAGHGHVMHGNSVSVKPGETKTLVWHFTKAGQFEFACNFPGHAELGMTGKLVVE